MLEPINNLDDQVTENKSRPFCWRRAEQHRVQWVPVVHGEPVFQHQQMSRSEPASFSSGTD